MINDNFIKSYWNSQGALHSTSHWASWGDEYMITLEIDTINKYIPLSAYVLDAGCANGYSSLKQLEKGKISSLVGIDYAEEMIKGAIALKKESVFDNKISFYAADIKKLPFEDASFDVVYTTRVLINLPTWEEQLQGIKECLRVTKTGGRVIFSEAFWEPLARLNSLRLIMNLPPLVEHDFNRYIKTHILDSFLMSQNISFMTDEFSSLYYLGTRVLRELMVAPSEGKADYKNPINKSFYELEEAYSFKGLSIQQMYILDKK